MEQAQFEVLATQTRMEAKALRMAKAVLVEGLTAAKAARNEGVKRQLAAQAVKRILRERQLVESYPKEWVTITATLPKQWAQLVKYIQNLEDEKAGIVVKADPRIPDFELNDIAEFSKLVEEILKKWRKL